SRARIRGFRPGRAPKEMVKRMYFPEIREEIIRTLVPRALNQELRNRNIQPVGQPVIREIHFEEKEPLRFKAQVEVWPEVNLPEYKGIRIRKPEAKVTEKEVEEALEELRKKSAQYVPVTSRGVKKGDYVVAEIKGRDEVTKRYLPTEKAVVLAGHEENEPTLNDHLIGLKAGEETRFTITYNKDHANKRLAGRTIAYILKVDSIKERRLPDLDDEFAKELGEYKDLKDLKTKIKTQLLDSKLRAQRQEMAEEIIQNISSRMDLELPESVVEQESAALLNRQLSAMPQQNLSQDTIESLKNKVREKAIRNVRNHLILTKIAELENLSVSEEEISKEMTSIAESHNVPVRRVEESFRREGRRDELKENLLLKKTVDFLIESAIIE
ncbi:MAG: trigger factor, partial [Candidatus Aminicenantales bacterium]